MQTNDSNLWRRCSSCKKSIGFAAKYYVCSVSTCNGQRTGYVFCSVPCWEVHLPGARHKDAAAIEMKSPAAGGTSPPPATSESTRRIISTPSAASSNSNQKSVASKEVLIIASRLKDYVHVRSEMNTSAQVMDVLSDFLRVACDRAIDNARADGRKTVLDRDFQFLKK